MEIQNQRFIVTGGASGLGEATVRYLHQHGGNVLALDVNAERGQALAAELGIDFAVVDITDEQAVQAVVDGLESIQGLINCAGIAVGEKVVGKDGAHRLGSFSRCIQINLIGSFNTARCVADKMSRQAPNAHGERGVIIHTASIAAFDGQIGQAAYAASKAGVVGMTLPMARELARYGIRVMTIAPGLFETPMMAGLPPEVQDSLGKTVPFPPRLGKGHEYAALVGQIVQNPMLNGETIRLDGALRMGVR
jgi:NAD(P)-dependent dehydrogenase (short-subunit alcohol dehydrogenase family)